MHTVFRIYIKLASCQGPCDEGLTFLMNYQAESYAVQADQLRHFRDDSHGAGVAFRVFWPTGLAPAQHRWIPFLRGKFDNLFARRCCVLYLLSGVKCQAETARRSSRWPPQPAENFKPA